MANTPFNVTELGAVLGPYCRKNTGLVIGEKLYRPGSFDPSRPTAMQIADKWEVHDEAGWATADFDPEVQDADNNFSAQGDIVTVRGHKLKVSYMRSDFKIHYRKLYNTWLAHIAKQSYSDTRALGSLRAVMLAFSDFIFNGVIDKFLEKFYLRTTFQAEALAGFGYTDPGNGNKWSYDAAADGWNKVLKDLIASGAVPASQVVASGGPLTVANTYDHFEALGLAIPPKLYAQELFKITSVKNSDNYNMGFKADNPGANPLIHNAYKRRRLENRESVAILPTPEMGGVDTTFMTTRENMIFATNYVDAPPEILTSVSEDPLYINVSLLFSCAMGFKRADEIIANDQ